MKPELSALLDGELDSHDAGRVIDEIEDEESLRVAWRDYQLIGDALRGKGGLANDITALVMERLEAEPVVLAPRARPQNDWRRSLMALAASLAGVAVVGWLALSPQEREALPPTAVVAHAGPPAAAVLAVNGSVNAGKDATDGDLREYLAAHQAYAGSLQFQGGTQQIRTVSVAVAK